MWTHSRGVCAWLVAVTVVCLGKGANGSASFKHLSREKRALLETIAVKQGHHTASHIKDMRTLSRVKRHHSIDHVDGFDRHRIMLNTVVVTAPRLPPRPPLEFGLPSRWEDPFPFPFGGGDFVGGARIPPPPPGPVPPEPREDKYAKKMTYQQFIYQLEKLEALLPDLPPDQMAHKLRMLVGRYNSFLWKMMLNVNTPIPFAGRDVEGFTMTPAQKGTFDQLREMMDHRFKGGAELGVIKVNGETVALDPTSPLIGPGGTWKNGKYELSGKGGMATRAEILGDIDGFNIGKRIMADRTKPLSQHIREYYTGESSRRFGIFMGHTTKANLKAEVYKFANLYDYKEAGLLASALRNSSPELALRRANEIERVATAAVDAFCTAFSSELGSWYRTAPKDMWTPSRGVRAWLVLVTVVCLGKGANGWASFKHLSREKRALLEIIAVKQGLHVASHIKDMRAVSRSKRQSDSCSSGGRGGGDSSVLLDTVVITAPRRPPSPLLDFGIPSRWEDPFPFPFGGGGFVGGAPAQPPKPPTPASAPPEPKEDKDAKKMTYHQFIYQLEKLEALLPDLPPDQMAHKLRMLVGRYDSSLWKMMLNVNNPIPLAGRDVEGFTMTPAQKGTFDQLREMMDHRFKGGAELGVIKVNGETVALDPTSPVIGPAGTWKNGKYELPGKGGMATRAEILGDIDGFNIGKRIMADSTKPLSQHLREYYTGESRRRFDIFTGHTTKANLKAEVYKFANLYDYKEAGLLASALRNSSPELAVRRANEIDSVAIAAVNAFCTAFSSKLGSW
ncbi:hypothetical protein MAR_016532, partial [Mya arenaria]